MEHQKTNHGHKRALFLAGFISTIILTTMIVGNYLQPNQIQTNLLRVQNNQKPPVRESRHEAEALLRDMQANLSKIQFTGLRTAMLNISDRTSDLSQVRTALNSVLSANYREQTREKNIRDILINNAFSNDLDNINILMQQMRFSDIETLLSFIDTKRAEVSELFAEWRGALSLVFGGKVLYIVNNAGTGGKFANLNDILSQHFGEIANKIQQIDQNINNLQNSIALIRQEYIPGLDTRIVNLVNSFPLVDSVPQSVESLQDAINPVLPYRTALMAVRDDIIALEKVVPAILVR